MSHATSDVARGLAAGAAGTAALNTVTYLDMAVRGRGASSTPAQTAARLADEVGVDLSDDQSDGATAKNRRSGLGALLGYVTGMGVGAGYGAVRARTSDVSLPAAAGGLTVAAMAGSAGPMAALGVTDPRQWGAKSWVMDLVPHLVYGVVTAAVYDSFRRR